MDMDYLAIFLRLIDTEVRGSVLYGNVGSYLPVSMV
jgi:hypothetical protein